MKKKLRFLLVEVSAFVVLWALRIALWLPRTLIVIAMPVVALLGYDIKFELVRRER